MIVIPAPIFIGIDSSRNPGFPMKTGTQSLRWFPTFVGTTSGCPRIKVRGRLLKSGMTEKVDS
jgi:hypothetical protein